jgi:hypothetical protein
LTSWTARVQITIKYTGHQSISRQLLCKDLVE